MDDDRLSPLTPAPKAEKPAAGASADERCTAGPDVVS